VEQDNRVLPDDPASISHEYLRKTVRQVAMHTDQHTVFRFANHRLTFVELALRCLHIAHESYNPRQRNKAQHASNAKLKKQQNKKRDQFTWLPQAQKEMIGDKLSKHR
jgi:hypothetical protein